MDTLTGFEQTLSEPRELRIADRCDRCNAQAFVIAWKAIDSKEMDLFLCGHHYAEYEPNLLIQGFEIADFRYKINERPQERAPEDETF